MSKKILPFVIPITACYPATSEASGILFADDVISDWMFNSFIQIFQVEGNNAIDYYDFSIDNNPFLSYNEISYSFIYNNWKCLIDFVISCINDGYYIRLFNNTSKNSLYKTNYVMQHDMLIYGYDDKNLQFYVADHFNNGKFESKVCMFGELESAIDTYNPDLFDKNPAFLNCAQIIRKEDNMLRLRFSIYTPKEMDYILTLNLPRIITSLEDYLDAKPTKNWYTRGRAMDEYLTSSHKWGIQCYDILDLHIESCMERKKKFSTQSFYIMYNHKIVMLERLRKIDKLYEFPNMQEHLINYEYLKILTYRLMMLDIKLQYIPEKLILVAKMKKLITEIKVLDCKYTEKLCDDLKKCYPKGKLLLL